MTSEALISAWPTLQHWIADCRDELRARSRLDNAVREWVALSRDAATLLPRDRVEQLVLKMGNTPLSALEREYVAATRQYSQAKPSYGSTRWRVFISHTSELRDFPGGSVVRGRGGAGDLRCRARDRGYGRLPRGRSGSRAGVCRAGAGVRRVRGGAGHPVRLPGAGHARGVVYGAGVRHRHRGGPGPAGVPAGHRRCRCGHPAVGVDRPRVRGPPGRVPPPGARQRAGHAVFREPGRARAAGGTLAAGTGRHAAADRQRDRSGSRSRPSRSRCGRRSSSTRRRRWRRPGSRTGRWRRACWPGM